MAQKIKEYKIKRENIYNINKKGFFISILIKLKKVFFKAAFKLGRVKNTIQNRNKKWITVLATICVDKIILLLGLIY